ncbi:MAG TPA: hypothetical protein DCF68_10960 [Cyanothece sp. UBA12306]|nr:hypothetical protein [Cyanothece sp. UBA12306]
MPRTHKVKKESENGKLAVQEPETTNVEILSEESSPLSDEEKKDLERLEAQVKSAVLEAAKALWEINSRRLYRERYATFEDYCEDTFKFSSRYIYYQVRFGQFLNTLEQSERAVQILPQSEYQARPLSKLKEESEQIEAWLEAVERAEGKTPPYSLVEQVVRKKLTPQEKTPKQRLSLSEGHFCQLGGQVAQVIASADGSYQLKRWDHSEATVAIDDVKELQVDKRSLSRVQSYFDQLGVAAALVERYREKTATAVLGVLAKAELPPTELETKLLKCLERELSRRDKAQAEQD